MILLSFVLRQKADEFSLASLPGGFFFSSFVRFVWFRKMFAFDFFKSKRGKSLLVDRFYPESYEQKLWLGGFGVCWLEREDSSSQKEDRQLFLRLSRDATSRVYNSSFRRCCGTAAAQIDWMSPSFPVSATALIGRQSLDNAITSQHPSIDRKISADHKRPHCCVLLGQSSGFVREIGLVFSPIYLHVAGVSRFISVWRVHWISPSTTSAQTWVKC